MPLYEITEKGLAEQPPRTFPELALRERSDLQRLLRDDIYVLDDDLLVVGEEWGDWEDARRRIDLLAIDRTGHLVVIELKRTEDGGHMELQALRYAAMVSAMQFDQVVALFAAFRRHHTPAAEIDARAELLDFLDDELSESGEPVISSNVRIVLVAQNFGRELTTTVLWLNGFDGIDIRCVRLVPYRIDTRVLLDIAQVVPLPDAADFQVRLRRNHQQQERARVGNGRDYTRYHVVADGRELPHENKRNSIRVMVEALLARGVPVADVAAQMGERHMKRLSRVVSAGPALEELAAREFPRFRAARYFVDHPFADGAHTYLLSSQWGTKTDRMLERLSAAFPDAAVSYRVAD